MSYLEDPKNTLDWFRIILQLLFFMSSFINHDMEVGILIIASVQNEKNHVRVRELLFGFIMVLQWMDMLQELRFWKKQREFEMYVISTMKAVLPFVMSSSIVFIAITDFYHFKEMGSDGNTIANDYKFPMMYAK